MGGARDARPATPWPEERTGANDARAVWAVHLAARRAFTDATFLLASAGVPSLAVKGAVTAFTLYREPTERPLTDVDLRVRPEDLRAAIGAFRGNGFRVFDWKPSYGAFGVERHGVCVDVESVVGAPGLCGLTVATMLSRAGPFAHDARVLVPELHDHALVLAVNVFKDKLTGAAPWAIEDARRMVEAEGFDAARFASLARTSRVAGLVWIVADWMAGEKESEGWSRVRRALGGDHGPRPLYAKLFRRLLARGETRLSTRVAARLAGDEPAMWGRALRGAVAIEWRLGGRRRDERRIRGE